MTQASQQYLRESDFLFKTIETVADNVGRTAALIEDPNMREKLIDVINCLSDIDKNMAADVEAIEHFQTNPIDNDQPLVETFNKIRDAIDTENLGRCHDKLEHVCTNINTISSQIEDSPDMEMLSVTYSIKDPITKANIKDPVKNSVCGHVYDRDSVSAFIDQCKKLRQLCQCPVRSCPNKQPLQMARMVSFPDFFNMIHND